MFCWNSVPCSKQKEPDTVNLWFTNIISLINIDVVVLTQYYEMVVKSQTHIVISLTKYVFLRAQLIFWCESVDEWLIEWVSEWVCRIASMLFINLTFKQNSTSWKMRSSGRRPLLIDETFSVHRQHWNVTLSLCTL